VFAGWGQLNNDNPSFGQGTKGFAHRLVTSYGDRVLGNMLSEGVFPVLLHEDPRYFRRGTGSTKSRLGYALSRTIITKTDSGKKRFNYSEWLGNASDLERVLSGHSNGGRCRFQIADAVRDRHVRPDLAGILARYPKEISPQGLSFSTRIELNCALSEAPSRDHLAPLGANKAKQAREQSTLLFPRTTRTLI
jgi:hypothetical protein